MARSISLSLSKTYLTTTTTTTATSAGTIRLLSLRHLSSLPPNNGGDVTEEATTDPLLKKLEEAIHRIIARRSAPDWLPFVPGASYWVPPPRSTTADGGTLIGNGIAQLVEKLANPLTDEQSLSVTTVRGWPSSDYFIKGGPPRMVEVKAASEKVEVEESSASPDSKEEEG